MQYLAIALAATGLVSSAMAAPTQAATGGAIPAGYEWNVSQWTAGCNDEHCEYSFLVSAPANGQIPSFRARCNGIDTPAQFTTCRTIRSSDDVQIMSKIKHQADPSEPNGPAKVTMSMEFTLPESGVDMTYSGSYAATYNAGNDGVAGKKFQITPTHASGS